MRRVSPALLGFHRCLGLNSTLVVNGRAVLDRAAPVWGLSAWARHSSPMWLGRFHGTVQSEAL